MCIVLPRHCFRYVPLNGCVILVVAANSGYIHCGCDITEFLHKYAPHGAHKRQSKFVNISHWFKLYYTFMTERWNITTITSFILITNDHLLMISSVMIWNHNIRYHKNENVVCVLGMSLEVLLNEYNPCAIFSKYRSIYITFNSYARAWLKHSYNNIIVTS